MMSRTASLAQISDLIALGAFADALRFIALVAVRFWLAAPPPVFLNWMANHFFRFPRIMVPLNAIALITAIATLTATGKPSARLPSGLSLLTLLLCSITFPLYFAGANAEFLTATLPLDAIAPHRQTWATWHWDRTGLSLLAVLLAAWV